MSLASKILSASGGVANKLYVDDVFSSYLRTGTGAPATVTTGIDLSTKGGMVWCKARSAATDSAVYDTGRGTTFDINTTSQSGQTTQEQGLTAFGTTGHTWGTLAKVNTNAATYVDWVFAKAPKFFDVVTYTGNGAAGRTIAHSLGTTPGMVIVKRTNGAGDWAVWHHSRGSNVCLLLNSTATTSFYELDSTDSSSFTVSASRELNNNSYVYVAYLFAHDAAADGIVQCGSFTTGVSGATSVTLGWEPQYILVKASSSARDWTVVDAMRGVPATGSGSRCLGPNLEQPENTDYTLNINATGFSFTEPSGPVTYVYLAIRRPNKPPASGTQVYNAAKYTGNGTAFRYFSMGFAPDLIHAFDRGTAAQIGNTFDVASCWSDRVRGFGVKLGSSPTGWSYSYAAESAVGVRGWTTDSTGIYSSYYGGNTSNNNLGASWATVFGVHAFKRAPGVFDIVCDTGTGSAHTVSHNLGAVPELMIRKGRSGATEWQVYASGIANTEKLVLNRTDAKATDAAAWNSTAPTSSVFTVGTGAAVNTNAATYVTYLFATLAGISKVGSYTGNGSSQTINCGFTTGARYILIKRTSASGGWLVWDTTRGIVSGNDPHVNIEMLGDTGGVIAEVTTDDSIDPDTSGFIVNQVAAAKHP